LQEEEQIATPALLKLTQRPDEAIAMIKKSLRPLKLSKKDLDSWVKALGNDDEASAVAAFEYLEYFDPRLADSLENLMDTVNQAPQRQRLVEILSGTPLGYYEEKTVTLHQFTGDDKSKYFNFSCDRGTSWAEPDVAKLNRQYGNPKKKWTRAVRCIALLEHLATPDARAILEDLASGDINAQPTQAARDALDRLAGKAVVKDVPAALLLRSKVKRKSTADETF